MLLLCTLILLIGQISAAPVNPEDVSRSRNPPRFPFFLPPEEGSSDANTNELAFHNNPFAAYTIRPDFVNQHYNLVQDNCDDPIGGKMGNYLKSLRAQHQKLSPMVHAEWWDQLSQGLGRTQPEVTPTSEQDHTRQDIITHNFFPTHPDSNDSDSSSSSSSLHQDQEDTHRLAVRKRKQYTDYEIMLLFNEAWKVELQRMEQFRIAMEHSGAINRKQYAVLRKRDYNTRRRYVIRLLADFLGYAVRAVRNILNEDPAWGTDRSTRVYNNTEDEQEPLEAEREGGNINEITIVMPASNRISRKAKGQRQQVGSSSAVIEEQEVNHNINMSAEAQQFPAGYRYMPPFQYGDIPHPLQYGHPAYSSPLPYGHPAYSSPTVHYGGPLPPWLGMSSNNGEPVNGNLVSEIPPHARQPSTAPHTQGYFHGFPSSH